MSKREQQDGASGLPQAADTASTPLPPHGAARRRLGKAGLAATGVLLTINSTPGMACEICTTPSGSLSGGLQSYRGPKPVCAGRVPSYWASHSWPSGTSGKKFANIFSCNYANSKTYGTSTMMNMLKGQSYDYPQSYVGAYLTAAWLNVKAGLSTFLTEDMLKKIWSEFQSKGYYQPTAGVKWYSDKISEYLQGTMY
ncbi:hypothetical protein [Massilia sp. BJB1822]|uniref:hypothetical protein n=1 Tax=Massilia sp. BJB1822 TaxID=2744470 RepID=UPI0015934007|nr:hypothetical protein [Massilia sp. BJB1822]NVD96934.1 hypothetical protein [Massilia sp. BJB1822]